MSDVIRSRSSRSAPNMASVFAEEYCKETASTITPQHYKTPLGGEHQGGWQPDIAETHNNSSFLLSSKFFASAQEGIQRIDNPLYCLAIPIGVMGKTHCAVRPEIT